jgi:NADH:ubiquinone oxidoreductase subunit F (NADH-binding)
MTTTRDVEISRALPRLLAGVQPDRWLSFDEHFERFGPLPGLSSADAVSGLMADVEASGLRGRGGAGFPAATKMSAVASRPGPRVVVANGTEGEPASRKDGLLLARAPHLVLDGLCVAARLVAADEAILCLKRSDAAAVEAVIAAREERQLAGLEDAETAVAEVSADYVAGEESALVNYLGGGDPKPTFVPPRPYEVGVGGWPTLILNVETLAHLALIARFGPAWFREIGTAEDPGSLLLTVSGCVREPGVYEVAAGTRMGDVIRAAGGPAEPLQAVLIGGYGGAWFGLEEGLELGLGHASLRAVGATLGPGVVIALPEGACGVLETARVADYLAGESSGQCGPCVHGLAAIAEAMAEISAGRASRGAHQWVSRWCEDVVGRGACHHPDGAARLIASSLRVFASEIDRHEQGRPCHPRPSLAGVLPLGGEASDRVPERL